MTHTVWRLKALPRPLKRDAARKMKSFVRFFVICGAAAGAALLIWGYRAWEETNRFPREAVLVEAENARLKIELSSLAEKMCDSTGDEEYLEARVFAEYPWNDRGTIIVNAGGAEGVTVGMAVLGPGDFLLGRVRAVRRHTAEVETIFDGAWRSSVALGNSTKAVLEGGRVPRLTLIPRDGGAAEEMSVTNISPDFPLGKPVGIIAALDKGSGVWASGTLGVPYALPDVASVKILTDFP